MGSLFEINDTLQISKEQGFPTQLDIVQHLKSPYSLDEIKDKTFKFSDKPKIRLYQQPPVRVFLVENVDGKWIYWGLAHILSVTHNYVDKTTSGTFKIIYLNSPEEMKQAYNLTDRRPNINYFSE